MLVDRPARSRAIFAYPFVWVAGDADLGGEWPRVWEEYVQKGGTLVVNIARGRDLPPALLGFRPSGALLVANKAIGCRVLRLMIQTLFGYLGRAVPLVGGLAIGFTDGWMMGRIAEQAKADFPLTAAEDL